MKALSIRQPWAHALLHCGKDIENRSWQPRNPGLRFRGPFLIHASSGLTAAEFAQASVDILQTCGTWIAREDLKLGGIVGEAEIVDVVKDSTSRWFFGPIGLVICKARPLPFVPLKGALGFFDAPSIARSA
jgi:hypothetical protein